MKKMRLFYYFLLLIGPLSGLAFFSPLAQGASIDRETIASCKTQKTIQNRIDVNNKKKTIDAENSKDFEKSNVDLEEPLRDATERCNSDYNELSAKASACEKRNVAIQSKNKTLPSLWKWDNESNDCVKTKDDSNSKIGDVEDADCSEASLFAGGLRGENCKKAATTIQSVESRNKSISETVTAGTSTFAQATAAMSSGKQQDAQNSQQKLLKTMAAAKIISSASSLAGALQLKSAAKSATEASDKMTSAYQNISKACANNGNFKDDQEGCFYAMAPTYNISPSKAAYVNYENLKSGAAQSLDQADRANAAFKNSTVTGLADAFVGLQAMKAANLAKQNMQNMNSLPVTSYIVNPNIMNNSGASLGDTTGNNADGGVDNAGTDNGSGGALLSDVGSGGGAGGIVPGVSYGRNGFVSAQSGVTGGGGGGGAASLGGGGGGAGRPNNSRKSSLGETGVGEYNLGGGLGGKGPMANTPSKEEEGNASFADALAKLFPKDENGKIVVDGRGLASQNPPSINEEAEPGSTAYPSEVTLFEQVNFRYRHLASIGKI